MKRDPFVLEQFVLNILLLRHDMVISAGLCAVLALPTTSVMIQEFFLQRQNGSNTVFVILSSMNF